MYSISTSWNSSLHTNGFDLINEVKALGFDTVELNFALTEEMVNDVLEMKCRGEIKVSSLHNICPLPKEIEPGEGTPDSYSLASTDDAERRLAVESTKNTIDYAKKLDARAVVLHTGRVQIKDRTRDLASVMGNKEKSDLLKEQMMKERAEHRSGYLDSVMKSLTELVPYSEKAAISLGIENRYYYREIPLIDEFEKIFKAFKRGSLYYWHDVGHAEVFERLGLARHKDYLERFRSRLIGVHLHDIIGAINDHNPPGFGMFDFRILKPYLKDNIIKVIEVHRPATAEQIRRGVDYLTKILG